MNENKEDNKLPAHFTLKLGVELNQIFLLRLRTPVVGLKLFNIFLGDLLVHGLEEVPQVVNHIPRKILM